MKFNTEGWLLRENDDDPEIEIIPAHLGRTYSKLDTGEPLGLVQHYTGTTGGEEAMARRLIGMPGDPGAADRIVSWHFLNLRNGKLIQQVSVLRGAAHIVNAGLIEGVMRRPNKTLLGCENANAGHLHRVEGRFYASWLKDEKGNESRALGPNPKSEIPAERVYGRPGVHYQERFTAAQVVTATALGNALLRRFPHWTPTSLTYTHMQFDQPRKMDPGRAWTDEVQPHLLANVVDPTPALVVDPFDDLPESLMAQPAGRPVRLGQGMTTAQRSNYARAGYHACRAAGLAVFGERRALWAEAARGYFDAYATQGADATLRALQIADGMARDARAGSVAA